MKANLLKCLAVFWCLVVAQSASAIPFEFDITSSSNAAAGGIWALTGPTLDGGTWAVEAGGSYSAGAELGVGEYTWSIVGLGGAWGQGLISWTLSLDGNNFYSGSDSGSWIIKVFDTEQFDVGPPVSVPEPSTLTLLGIGLLAVGLSARRKRRAS